MADHFDGAANDMLQYPKDFQGFLAVVDMFGRAREIVRKPGEGFNEALLRTTDEIGAALAIFREVWARAEAASPSLNPVAQQTVRVRRRALRRSLGHRPLLTNGERPMLAEAHLPTSPSAQQSGSPADPDTPVKDKR